ncbi:MAG: T9SS type A sorting domain-containing protein [Bacteroidota bacterium]
MTWSVSPTNLFAIDNGSGNTFTTRAENNALHGTGTIIATIDNGCDQINISIDVWVGKPEHVTGILSGPSTVYTSNLYFYSVTDQYHYSGAFDWTTPRGFTRYGGGDGYNYVHVGISEFAWDGYVQVWRKNVCGNSGARWMYVTVEEGGGGPIETIISPNPATDEISIEFANPKQLDDYLTSLDAINESMDIEIVSIYGEKVYSSNITKEGLNLNLKFVKRGLYVVKVSNNKLTSEARFLLE